VEDDRGAIALICRFGKRGFCPGATAGSLERGLQWPFFLFQVQKYVPTIQEKYKPLPLSIEALFEKDVAKLVSNKLPGRFFITKIS
jgi:hypothetical protein